MFILIPILPLPKEKEELQTKAFYFDENKEKYKEWEDKIIHVKCIIPESITDVWSRERYQRNSFMSSLYYLGLSDNDSFSLS